MSPLHVVATIPAKSGSEDAVRDALATLAAATREEEGCVSYELFESAATPGTFFTLEVWRGQDDMDAHMRTPHVAAAFDIAGPLLGGDVGIHPLTPVS